MNCQYKGLPVDKTAIDEFNELNQAPQPTSAAAIYLNQREFTENAAHEMQTPLAIIQGKIDLLMQTEPLSEEQAKLINGLEEANLRLVKLNRSLLLLSKIENNQFSEMEEIDLKEIMIRMLVQYREMADARNIRITEEYDNDLTMRGNRVQVEILTSNLLMNAIRHNIERGEIRIEIHNRTLVIKNRGASKALPVDKMFERFYKSGQDSASVGLGLSIVKSICESCHYSIGYEFVDGWHAFIFSPDSK
jgi:signal transduction histidine kinase